MISRGIEPLALVGVVACCAAPGLPPPPPSPPVEATHDIVAVEAAEEVSRAPRYVVNAPFSIVARASGEHRIEVFPLEDGDALVAVAPSSSGPTPIAWAHLSARTIELAPELAKRLPALELQDDQGFSKILVAGRWPRPLWLAAGTPCNVREWTGDGWEVRPPALPSECESLTPWVKGAALTLSRDGVGRLVLRGHGSVPTVMPELTPAPRRYGELECAEGPLSLSSERLKAFESGEVVTVGTSCGVDVVIERWASGTKRSTVTNARVTGDAPYFAAIRSPNDVLVDGLGWSAAENDAAHLTFEFAFLGGGVRVSEEPSGINRLEYWIVESVGPAQAGFSRAAGGEGLDYRGFRLTETSDVFVLAAVLSGGRPMETLLLRNRPVDEPLVVQP